MTLGELKLLFRQSVKVVLGGPKDKTRGEALIASLDALAEQATGNTTEINAESIVDATEAGRAMLMARDAAAQLLLVDKLDIAATPTYPEFTQAYGSGGAIKWLLDKVGNATVVPQPVAPTGGQVDDTANTFSVLAVAGYASYPEYVYFTPDSNGVQPLAAPAGYQSGNRITLGGLTGDYPKNSVGIAVAGSGSRPQGAFATNAEAFTGTGTTTPPSTEGLANFLVIGSDGVQTFTVTGS